MKLVQARLTRWAALGMVTWSLLLALLWVSDNGPYAGNILCPTNLSTCHDHPKFPIASWVIGLLVIVFIAAIVQWWATRRSTVTVTE